MSEVTQTTHPERGFLQSFRTWRDLFPWLGITDCLRVATSLLPLTLVSLGLVAAVLIETQFADRFALTGNELQSGIAPRQDSIFAPGDGLHYVIGPVYQILEQAHQNTSPLNLLPQAFHQAILLMIWLVPASFIIRQSGLTFAGRPLRSTTATLSLIASRWSGYLAALIIPTVAMSLILLYFCMAFLTSAIPVVGPSISHALQILGLPLVIAAGLISFGGLVAIPLAWVAVTLESDGSAFDAVSRGFEYTLRRPIQWVGYGAIGWLVIVVLRTLASGVSIAAVQVIRLAYSLDLSILPLAATGELASSLVFAIPAVVEITVFFCLLPWLYLLLRRSTNGQEIEDVWEQPLANIVALPKLNVDSAAPQNQP